MAEYVIIEDRASPCSFQDNENFIQENNELQKRFSDLLNIGLSNEYFAAEHQYCMMIREIQERYLEQINIETDFLEG